MKIKRAKQYKRLMTVYSNTFGFREPYQILVDGNFLQVTVQMKTDVTISLPKVLMGEVKPMTTYCVEAELKALGKDFASALLACRQLERRRCPHTGKPVSPGNCLAEIIGVDNKNKYGVASQDSALRAQLRKVPGVPLIYISNSVVIIEPPSRATERRVQEREVQKVQLRPTDKALIEKKAPTGVGPAPQRPPRRKKPQNPNPLSVKKKKKKPEQQQQQQRSGVGGDAKQREGAKKRSRVEEDDRGRKKQKAAELSS